jgi:hypothetical protein
VVPVTVFGFCAIWPLHVSASGHLRLFGDGRCTYTAHHAYYQWPSFAIVIRHSSSTPGVFYTKYFYNHAHRLRLENYYTWSFLEVPADFLNHFWIQAAVSELKPPHGGFRIETAVTWPFRK